ncbi:MAG: signal peptidase I [Bacilli bacterium]|nr:signal peptidase I [Bacilli bacterium]
MKKFKVIISSILIFVVSIILLLNIFSALRLSFFGYRLFQVQTGSMEPKIKINDLIIIKEKRNYKKNDIVTYKDENNNYVTHRIVKITKKEVIAKGDANNTEDKPISKNKIIGKVVFKFRFINIVNKILRNYIVLTAIFIMGILVILFLPNKKV